MKKKNLLFTLAVTALSISTFTVNAVAPKTTNDTLDATKCQDGKVYTNYYYLSDAIWKNASTENTTSTGAIEGLNKAYETQGKYSDYISSAVANVIGTDNLKAAALNGKINVKEGVVNIVETGNSDYINQINLTDFWNNFNAYYTSGLKDSASSDGKSITNITVAHAWAKFDFATNTWGDLSTDHVATSSDIAKMVKASIKLPDVAISYDDNLSTQNEAYIKIVRNYNNGAYYYTNPHEGIDYTSGENNHKIYFQPQLYYVQYCVAAEAPEKKVLKYDGNGEGVTGVPDNVEFTTLPVTLSSKIPKRTGYKFLGWATSKSPASSATLYQPSAKYSEEATTLYAQWEKEDETSTPTDTKTPFTLTYNPNKGTAAPKAQTSTGECVKISDAGDMNRTGYRFVGWATKADATEADKDYAPGKDYCGPTKTIYAVWAEGEATNPNTAVSAHLVAFAIAAVTAGAALVVARKKGLFKQI